MHFYLKQSQFHALLPIAYDMVMADLLRERKEINTRIEQIESERAKRDYLNAHREALDREYGPRRAD